MNTHIPWNKGKHMSEETKKKISVSRTGVCAGKDHPMFGKHHTPEAIGKIRKANLGHVTTPETRAKLGKKGPLHHAWKGGRDHRIKHLKEWREQNKEYVAAYRKTYTETHREFKNYLNNKRRLKKRSIIGSHTLQEWVDLKAKYNFTCLSCHKSEPEITLSVDHIVPISMSGTDDISNLQPLCRSCNSIKYNKYMDFREVTVL